MESAMDATVGEPGQVSVRTPAELAVERMQAQIDELRGAYESRIAELTDANRGLWAELHKPAAAVPDPEPVQAPAWDPEKALASFKTTMGISD